MLLLFVWFFLFQVYRGHWPGSVFCWSCTVTRFGLRIMPVRAVGAETSDSVLLLHWNGRDGEACCGTSSSSWCPWISHRWPQMFWWFTWGSNDLARNLGKSLILQKLSDLKVFTEHCLSTHVVCSAIVPRLLWRANCNPKHIDKARQGVNREVGRIFRQH